MPEFVKVCKVTDVPDQCSRCVEVGGRAIGIFNLGGEFFAIDDLCTHAEASLCEGQISGDEIACPLHYATFNIRTGECTGPPADEDLATYPIRVCEDDIEVAVE